MRHPFLLRAAGVAAATLVVASTASAQTACTTKGVALRSFSPVDSLFPNPTATSFTIRLVNAVGGCPTEYRVSRFADFRDATWTPYNVSPNTVVQRTWFPTTTNGSTEITLYFQVRQKNPQGGFPVSVGGTLEKQPMYFFSDVLGRRIRVIYFG